MADQPLITKYRPVEFGEVLGHELELRQLQRAIAEATRPHSYLFTGPSGIGKTTLARIIGSQVQAEITEVDAASNSGVDAMRALTDLGQYMSMVGDGNRLLIIDECHRLSRNAWDAILKLIEEPPDHLFLALCTTELQRVPETIRTRCYHVSLKPLPAPDIDQLLQVICDCEEWIVAPEVLLLVTQAATGQPRKALSILQQVRDIKTREEAKRIIALVEASEPLIEMLQHLLAGKKSWVIVRGLLAQISESDFEEVAIIAGRYISGALMHETNEKRAASTWQLLEALMFPSATYDRRTAFIAAIGRMIWGGT